MKRSFIGPCATLLLLVVALTAHAQEGQQPPPALLERPAAAQGYYFTLGFHGGSLSVNDETHSLKPLGGFSGALHIGQEVTRWMDLGIALELGSVIDAERTGSVVSFGIDWTIRPVGDAFVRLGCGIGANQLSAPRASDNKASAFGGLATITLGYAWFPFREAGESGGFSASPVIRLTAIQPFANDAAYWALAGFELSFWTGLPKRQLDLPLEDAFPSQRKPASSATNR